MNDFAVKVLTAPAGRTYIFSTGQAGYIIKSKCGEILGLDLYLTDCVERVEGHVGYHRLLPKILSPDALEFDVVIASHPHKDHFDDDAIPLLMSNGKTELFASVNCEEDMHRLGLGNERATYVQPGDSYQKGSFSFHFVNCDHGKGAPDAVGVIIAVDGKKIYFAGDTCLRLDRKEEYLSCGQLDVMIAPINGAYGNMNEIECSEMAEALKPRLTIPCHFGMFASHGGDAGKFYNIMKEKHPELPIKLMTQGECVEI